MEEKIYESEIMAAEEISNAYKVGLVSNLRCWDIISLFEGQAKSFTKDCAKKIDITSEKIVVVVHYFSELPSIPQLCS